MPLTSQIKYIRAVDTTVATGAGKTGIAFGSFAAKYNIDGGTLVSLTTETITTLGTYQAPTSAAHIRIKELNSADPTKGVYEVHFHNTQLATGTKLWLYLSATDALIQPLEISLVNDVSHIAGQSQVAPGAASGLVIAGTNAPITFTGSGSAMTLFSSGGNGAGLLVAGNGSGNGAIVIGGATGVGVQVNGGATSGSAASFSATDGHGVAIAGGGTNNSGMRLARGGTGGDDLLFVNSDCTILSDSTYGLPAILTQFRLRVPRKTWFVSPATGSDANVGTYESPFQTATPALAAARALDTIVLMDNYSGTITLTSNPWVTLEGITQSVTVTAAVTTFLGVITGGTGSTIRKLTVTPSGNNGTAITFFNASYGLVEDCILSGVWDTVLCGEASGIFPRGFRMLRNYCFSKGDVLNVTGAKDIYLEGNTFYSDGTGLSVLAGTENNHGILCSNGTTGELNNNTIKVRRSTAYNGVGGGYLSAGIIGGATSGGDPGKITIRGGQIDVATLGATDGGTIRGLASHPTSPQALHAVLDGVEIITALAGTGTRWDVDASTSGSWVGITSASRYAVARLNGAANIETDLSPTTAGRKLTVSATGAGSLNWGDIENKTTVNNLTNTEIENGGGGGGGTPAQVDNSDIVEPRVFKLSRRYDGVVTANGTLRMRVGETYPVWIDASAFCGGRNLENVTDEVSNDEGVVTIDSLGMFGRLVVLWPVAVAEGSTTIQATAHPRSEDSIICELAVEVSA